MNKVWMALLASAFTVPAFGQSGEPLYSPVRTIKDQGITVNSWGSGTISETDEMAYEGTHSIRVSTRNLFQGGAMNFGSPVDLSRQYEDKNNLLRLVFRTSDGGGTTIGGGMPGAGMPGGGLPGAGGGRRGPGGMGGPGGVGGVRGGGGFPGGGFPGGVGGGRQGGGMPGGGFPGGGFPGGMGGATAATNPMKTMRFVIATTDGKRSEAYVPVTTSTSSERGWKSVSIPLQAIAGFDRTNRIVKSVTLTGDGTSVFYVGDLRVVNDSTPIRAEPNVRTLNLALNDQVLFSATGSGGSSILRYTWDFDDKDGADQADAEGQAVYRRFRKAGTYNVTLTVADYYGLKTPYKTTIKVVVNP